MNEPLLIAIATGINTGAVFLLQIYFSERIKKKFTSEITALQAQLQKQNIAYQANISKYVENKFEKVSLLFKTLTNQYNKLFEFLPDGTEITIALLKKKQETSEIDFYIFKNVIDESLPYISEEIKNEILIFATYIRAKSSLEAQIDIDTINWNDFQRNPNVTSEGAEYYENLGLTIDDNVKKVRDVSIILQKSFRKLSNSLIDILKSNET